MMTESSRFEVGDVGWVPILMIHGSEDMMAPVESSRFIQDQFNNLGKNNLYYIEYQRSGHDLGGDFDRVISDIENWFNIRHQT